ncbi:hypothetical protein EE612_028765 [Oryza sativa]|nr:hypothetical protein EE612_028765 [Oryza sativa]
MVSHCFCFVPHQYNNSFYPSLSLDTSASPLFSTIHINHCWTNSSS